MPIALCLYFSDANSWKLNWNKCASLSSHPTNS